MRVLITAGPTQEPIDPVRYLGNRSSGRLGVALAEAASRAGHVVTTVCGPMSAAMPEKVARIDVITAAQMLDAVQREFPSHDALIMAAAVADYRPAHVSPRKLERAAGLTLKLEPTEDILASVGAAKRADQRTIGFSLESAGEPQRAGQKLVRKRLDLIVYNQTATLSSEKIDALLIWQDGRAQALGSRSKGDFADILLAEMARLFDAKT